MELWLVRHGQTADNHLRILAGHQPGKLSQLGISQAAKVGKRLAKIKFTEIYCSDLGRAKETLETMSLPFTKDDEPPITYSSLLREKGAGALEGQPLGVWKDSADKAGLGIRKYKPEGGESWEDVYSRGEAFLDMLIEKYVSGDGKEEKTLGQNNEGDILGESSQLKDEEKKTEKFEEKKLDMAVSGQTIARVMKVGPGMIEDKVEKGKGKLAKILIVAHGGYIMEFFNVVNFRRIGQRPIFLNDTKNCSISIIRVYAKQIGNGQTKKSKEIVYEMGVKNDVAHL